jgi:hypothetical protein
LPELSGAAEQVDTVPDSACAEVVTEARGADRSTPFIFSHHPGKSPPLADNAISSEVFPHMLDRADEISRSSLNNLMQSFDSGGMAIEFDNEVSLNSSIPSHAVMLCAGHILMFNQHLYAEDFTQLSPKLIHEVGQAWGWEGLSDSPILKDHSALAGQGQMMRTIEAECDNIVSGAKQNGSQSGSIIADGQTAPCSTKDSDGDFTQSPDTTHRPNTTQLEAWGGQDLDLTDMAHHLMSGTNESTDLFLKSQMATLPTSPPGQHMSRLPNIVVKEPDRGRLGKSADHPPESRGQRKESTTKPVEVSPTNPTLCPQPYVGTYGKSGDGLVGTNFDLDSTFSQLGIDMAARNTSGTLSLPAQDLEECWKAYVDSFHKVSLAVTSLVWIVTDLTYAHRNYLLFTSPPSYRISDGRRWWRPQSWQSALATLHKRGHEHSQTKSSTGFLRRLR